MPKDQHAIWCDVIDRLVADIKLHVITPALLQIAALEDENQKLREQLGAARKEQQ